MDSAGLAQQHQKGALEGVLGILHVAQHPVTDPSTMGPWRCTIASKTASSRFAKKDSSIWPSVSSPPALPRATLMRCCTTRFIPFSGISLSTKCCVLLYILSPEGGCFPTPFFHFFGDFNPQVPRSIRCGNQRLWNHLLGH
jgi:hypothetical protein